MSLQEFFESTVGQIVCIAIIAAIFAAILLSGKNKKPDVKKLVVCALLVALGIVLKQIVIFRLPQGGSVAAFGMLPIVLAAYMYGLRTGVMCGFSVGIIDFMLSPYIIHPVQALLDYPFACAALGLSAIVFKLKKDGFIPAYLTGVFCRYICTVLSGIVFFGAYTPDGWNTVLWSVVYNFTYIAVEALMTVIVLWIPAVRKCFMRVKRETSIEEQ